MPDQYYLLFLISAITFAIVLAMYLYIRQQTLSFKKLSAEIKDIKITAEQRTNQLKTAQLELKQQTSLLSILQQANLNFLEHSELERSAQFMMDKLMEITDSKCGFIGEVIKQHNGKTNVRLLTICHHTSQTTFTDTIELDNPFTDNEDMVNEVLQTGQVVIHNDQLKEPKKAGMPTCCEVINNSILVPVFYGSDIVGIYGFSDCQAGYEYKLTEFLQPFNASYAVLIHAQRSYVEQVSIQENLLLAKLEADKASYAKSEFLSRMSHELRTPLNVILGYSQLLLDEVQYKIEPDVANCLSKVEQSGKHLLKLINEVLDLSHVESGVLNMDLKPISLEEVMSEAINMVTMLTKSKRVQVFYTSENFSNTSVQADRLRLLQVLVNLLSNAIKYNREDGIVNINGHIEDNIFIISIKDTGIGIPEDKHDKLFVAFDRLGAESSDIEGTGIGLPITKKLIEAMGGQLKIKSKINKGSTFYVHLNHSHPAQDQDEPLSTVDTLHLAGIEQGSHTILYVEDSKENTALVEKILSRYSSIHLVTAEDGLTGLQLAASINPDIILLDIQLPDLNGFDVIEQLRDDEETAYIPVLGVSANAMPQDIDNALSAGFDNYITKPINIRAFLGAINDTLVSLNKTTNVL